MDSRPPSAAGVIHRWPLKSLSVIAVLVAANILVDLALIALFILFEWRYEISRVNTSIWFNNLPAIAGVLAGSILTQIVIAAICTALMPGKSTTRWLGGTLLVVLGAVCLASPIYSWRKIVDYLLVGVYDVDPADLLAAMLFAMAPSLLLYHVAQIPFWLLRRGARLQLTPTAGNEQPSSSSLRLIDLFGMLSFLAIIMALARIATLDVEVRPYAFELAIVCGTLWLLSVTLLLAAMANRRPYFGAVIVIALCALFAWLSSAAVFYFSSRPPPLDVALVFKGAATGMALIVLAHSTVARLCGFRLVASWPLRRPAIAQNGAIAAH